MIVVCCDTMRRMLDWGEIKVTTIGSGLYLTYFAVGYGITYCPYCGQKIECKEDK